MNASMRASSSRTKDDGARRALRSRPRRGSGSRLSADLAGRAVGLSIDVPAAFEVPLGQHQKLVGRWAANRDDPSALYTRQEALGRIERMFEAEVLEILKPVDIAEYRVVVLHGPAEMPPAIGIACNSVGQVELGWIERDNVLSNAILHGVAPLAWRATAYKALTETLWAAMPVFGYLELVEEMANYYWEGSTDDEGARDALTQWHGADPDECDEMLPSAMHAKLPAWMQPKNARSPRKFPARLRQRLEKLRDTHKALRDFGQHTNAWHYDPDELLAYLPEAYDASTLPPMTLVPAEHFGRELDDIGRMGMEAGFMDTVGLCPVTDPDKLDEWFVSLKLGADFLVAAQDLINFNPRDL
jgi:hypothetical protein